MILFRRPYVGKHVGELCTVAEQLTCEDDFDVGWRWIASIILQWCEWRANSEQNALRNQS